MQMALSWPKQERWRKTKENRLEQAAGGSRPGHSQAHKVRPGWSRQQAGAQDTARLEQAAGGSRPGHGKAPETHCTRATPSTHWTKAPAWLAALLAAISSSESQPPRPVRWAAVGCFSTMRYGCSAEGCGPSHAWHLPPCRHGHGHGRAPFHTA